MFFIIICVSGCGLIPLPDNLFGEEDLTSTEVLERSEEQVQALYGYQILTKGQVTQTIYEGSNRREANFSFEYDQKFNNQPQALYSQQKRQDQTGKYNVSELYIVDGSTYVNDGTIWRKSPTKTDQIVLSQNPVNFLRFANEAQGQGVTLNKEEGAYVITLDQNAGSAFLRQFYHEAKSGLETNRVQISENDFQTDHFEQRIWIDDQTFLPQKMETDLSYNLQYLGRSVKNESRLQVTFEGEYNQQIQVPDDVKNRVGF